jgi:hypothetical protein
VPLLKGKSNIGHNIEEMQSHGHPHKQAVAAALHTALDTGGDMPEKLATTAMTAAEINEKNRGYWGGENGNVASPVHAPVVAADRKPVPVWHGHGLDEVEPTQSEPADNRSDNLLERGHGGLDGVVSGYRAGKAAGEELAGEGRVPGMDSTEQERTARKQANPHKLSQAPTFTPEQRNSIAKSLKGREKPSEFHKRRAIEHMSDSEENLSEASAAEPLGDVTDAMSPEEAERNIPRGNSKPITPAGVGATGGGKEGKNWPWPRKTSPKEDSRAVKRAQAESEREMY